MGTKGPAGCLGRLGPAQLVTSAPPGPGLLQSNEGMQPRPQPGRGEKAERQPEAAEALGPGQGRVGRRGWVPSPSEGQGPGFRALPKL